MNPHPHFLIRRMISAAIKRELSSGSSDALGFAYSTSRGQTASAPDELMVRVAVHLTPAFKLDRDAPRDLLQHWMNRCYREYLVVHPTLVFESYSTALSEGASTPDKPTWHRCKFRCNWLYNCVQRLVWRLSVTR
jgi:hypothetical protein